MTTEVAFHFNADDKIGYAARLIRKGYGRGARMLVWVDGRQLERLSHMLWTQTPGDFVGHARPVDPPPVQHVSRIVLVSELPEEVSPDTMLVNLTSQFPGNASTQFSRIFEIVTLDESDRAGARDRWKAYRQAGLEPLRHDLAINPA